MRGAIGAAVRLTMARISRFELDKDKSQPSNMLNAFLHEGASVTDFVLLGRRSSVSAVLGKHASKFRREDGGRFHNERDRMAAAVRFMDGVTDAKMIREAQVYRPILVDCE